MSEDEAIDAEIGGPRDLTHPIDHVDERLVTDMIQAAKAVKTALDRAIRAS